VSRVRAGGTDRLSQGQVPLRHVFQVHERLFQRIDGRLAFGQGGILAAEEFFSAGHVIVDRRFAERDGPSGQSLRDRGDGALQPCPKFLP